MPLTAPAPGRPGPSRLGPSRLGQETHEDLVGEQTALRCQAAATVDILDEPGLAAPRQRRRDLGSLGKGGLDALDEAQPQDGRLGERRGLVEHVAAAGWQTAGVQCLDIARQRCRVPAPHPGAVEGMRTRPDREVRPTVPIQEVVTTLEARARQVGDLVAIQARRSGDVVGEQLHGRRAVLGLAGASACAPGVGA